MSITFITHTPKPYLKNPFCKSRANNAISQREWLFKKYRGKCCYCKCEVYPPKASKNEVLANTATIEHKYSMYDIRRGIAKNKGKYLMLACSDCNSKNGRKESLEFWKGYSYEWNAVNIFHIWLTGKVITKPT